MAGYSVQINENSSRFLFERQRLPRAIIFQRQLQRPRRSFGWNSNFDPELLALFKPRGVIRVFRDVEIDRLGQAHLVARCARRSSDSLRARGTVRIGNVNRDQLVIFHGQLRRCANTDSLSFSHGTSAPHLKMECTPKLRQIRF